MPTGVCERSRAGSSVPVHSSVFVFYSECLLQYYPKVHIISNSRPSFCTSYSLFARFEPYLLSW